MHYACLRHAFPMVSPLHNAGNYGDDKRNSTQRNIGPELDGRTHRVPHFHVHDLAILMWLPGNYRTPGTPFYGTSSGTRCGR